MNDIEKIMLYVAFAAGVMYLWNTLRAKRQVVTPAQTTQTPAQAAQAPLTLQQLDAMWLAAHGGS
jgi:hypothetical protein